MGLFNGVFGATKTKSVAPKRDFRDIVVETSNVDKELRKIASKFGLSVSELDFTVISYKSYFKLSSDSKKYRLLKEVDKQEILTRENFLSPEFAIRQQYKINIFKKISNSQFPIKITLGANKDFTKVVANFKKSSNITYHDRLFGDISTQIDKKKLKQGIFLGIMNDQEKQNINKIVSHIMINKALIEDKKIVLCEGIERFSQSGEVAILRYKEENEFLEGNIKQKSNVAIVKKDDIVIEVILAQVGSDGRNCKGEFLERLKSSDSTSLKLDDITHSENIYKKEDGNRVFFIANKDGYIYVANNYFDVSDEMAVKQVNMRTTGSITGEDNGIKLNIDNDDEMSDAIGSGVTLEAQEIKTRGNVGSNTKLKADLVEIEGQTHQNSQIKAKVVKIKLHKGHVEADKVNIDTLEGGTVIADEVFVNTLSGGMIKAKKIFILKVISNAEISASEIIEISEVAGSNNKLIIDPRAQRGYDQFVSDIEVQIDNLEDNLKNSSKTLNKLKKKIIDDRDTIEEVTKRVKEMKNSKQRPPQAMINKLHSDRDNKMEFNKIVTVAKDLKEQREQMYQKIQDFDESVLDARIVVNAPWKEYNEVMFKLTEPKLELLRSMEDGEIANNIGLKLTKDKEYIIANLDD